METNPSTSPRDRFHRGSCAPGRAWGIFCQHNKRMDISHFLYAVRDLNDLPGKHVFFTKWISDDPGVHRRILEGERDREPDAPELKKGNQFERIVSAWSYVEGQLPGTKPNERVLAHLLQRCLRPERRKSRRFLRCCKYERICFLIKRMR